MSSLSNKISMGYDRVASEADHASITLRKLADAAAEALGQLYSSMGEDCPFSSQLMTLRSDLFRLATELDNLSSVCQSLSSVITSPSATSDEIRCSIEETAARRYFILEEFDSLRKTLADSECIIYIEKACPKFREHIDTLSAQISQLDEILIELYASSATMLENSMS